MLQKISTGSNIDQKVMGNNTQDSKDRLAQSESDRLVKLTSSDSHSIQL